MIDNDLKNYILSHTAVTDLISTRLYLEVLPDVKVYPLVMINRTKNLKNKRSKIYSPVYQISSFSQTLAESETILKSINNIIEDFKGKWGESSIIDVTYTDIKRKPFDTSENVFQSILEIKILHK